MPEAMQSGHGLVSRGSPKDVVRRARGDSLLRAGRIEEAREVFAVGAKEGLWRSEWQRPAS